MTTASSRFVCRVVRTWTRLYTCGLPAAVRNRRRAEIESDLWESERDREGISSPRSDAHVIARLVRGMAADLTWRAEQPQGGVLRTTRLLAWTLGMLVLLATWWVFGVSQTDELPRPTGQMRFIAAPPPPPEIEGP
jgi:hypothetical protein